VLIPYQKQCTERVESEEPMEGVEGAGAGAC
jgi:hypothetical protein